MKKIAKIFIVMCVVGFTASTTFAQVSVGLSVRIAPPELPVYVQPACPTDGYLWQPGYWAYDDADGYYWVPGVWVAPPDPGLLWTPPYWGFVGGYYGFHSGYWGPHVGFYGGINYGYGYGGHGFYGGRWSGNRFNYNTAVMHVNRTVIHNTYVDRSVVRNTSRSRYSFNGRGGVNAKPGRQEQAAMRDRHVQPTSSQVSHQQSAQRDKNSFAKVNHGRPASAGANRTGGTHNNAGRTPNRPTANVGSGAARPERSANSAARAPRQQQRATQQRAQQQPRMQQQRAPQQRVQQQRAPQQQRVQQQRAQQQPRMQQRAPQQQRVQQQPRMQQAQRAPQQRVQAQPRPSGGGGHGGGERGHH